MKNFSKYFLMGTVALSGMTAFTACSSENEPSAEVNPTFNGSTVKTQFALNLPYAATGTRQSADVAQQNNNFRGIQDMRLLPFTGNDPVAAGQTSDSLLTLGYSSDAFQSDGSTFTDQGRYIYRDVEIPVGTRNFVFYGKAKGEYTSVDNKFTNGNLVEKGFNVKKVPLNKVEFSLELIKSKLNLANADAADDTKSYNKVLKALQTVTETEVTSADKTIKWTNITVPASGETDYAKLNHAKKLWEAFKTLKAGSAASVREALTRLDESVGVKALADVTTAKCNGEGLLQTLKANIAKAKELLDKNEENNQNTFPADLNLPDGAVQVEFSETGNKWSFKSPTVQVGGASIDYAKITYPAALYYTVNTPVKANDNPSTGLADGMWPTKDDWTQDKAAWTGWGSQVVNSTRTIALEKAIQYGVANLKTTVKLKDKNLDDNAKAQGGQVADQNIAVNGNLKLTGVLVGGQPQYVGWEFKAPAATSFGYTVYDKNIDKSVADLTTTQSNPNYTLVLDNNNNKAEQENVVYVVLEFVNNTGVDFYGKDGMVPKGGKFYLVGKLDKAATTGVTNTKNVDHIFIQDHTTVANFTIKDLKDAYNTIPDLRSTSVSVGLAVNLTWQEGITFDVEI